MISPLKHTIRTLLLTAAIALPAIGVGCIEHRVKTDPIHITMDINVRVDEELTEFFAYENEVESQIFNRNAPSPKEPQ